MAGVLDLLRPTIEICSGTLARKPRVGYAMSGNNLSTYCVRLDTYPFAKLRMRSDKRMIPRLHHRTSQALPSAPQMGPCANAHFFRLDK